MRTGYLITLNESGFPKSEETVASFSISSDSAWKPIPWTLGTDNEVWNCVKPPAPFASWVFNEAIGKWTSPAAYPLDGRTYRWDEPTTNWIEVTND